MPGLGVLDSNFAMNDLLFKQTNFQKSTTAVIVVNEKVLSKQSMQWPLQKKVDNQQLTLYVKKLKGAQTP